MKKNFVFPLGLIVCALSIGVLHAQAGSSTSDGVYTVKQAGRGNTLYQTQCAVCHGNDLEGSGQNPPLIGNDFLTNWVAQPLGSLFDKIQETMPASSPGSLTRQQNAAILAFILSSNKFPSGNAALPADAASLKRIRIDKAPSKK